eukprot:CAMPEP_0174269070 /NCGR_PEP_ID=MMETSP0439-20130205/39751_1 /TAXON_ID=0 /ORGANISM="Stereomyxa ramosa, Strain Chinc5" /LENGTH=334 /DNA_ID=CAMNT_0015357641 /DNA_START=467 /DNA_END=1471 /DNA_ORIENTATION=-
MKYLSSRQALADAADFIVEFNKTLNNPGPWIVWGCSYSGGLSAWFRAKYPNLVIASIAPSGPVFATNNFTGYYNQFSYSANQVNPECLKVTQEATKQVIDLLSTSDGRASLTKTFNACQPIQEDNYYFKLLLTEVLGSSTQFENPPDFPLIQTCETMLSSSDYVSNWAKVVFSQSDPGCVDFNETTAFLQPLQDTTSQSRSWFFQKCTEFGYFKPSYEGTSVFFPTLNVEHQIGWCEQIFGIPDMTPNLQATNEYYGGYDLKGNMIMFTNGLLDPWHNLSINNNISSSVLAVTYNDGHCAPMDKEDAKDDPTLKSARIAVKNFIKTAIDNYKRK